MNNINLVSGRSLDLEKQAKRLKLLRMSAIAALILIALLSIIFFIITLTLPISSVKNNQQQTLSGISLLHKKLVTYSLVNERLKNISGIIRTRSKNPEITKTILSTVDQGLNVDRFSLEDGKLNMSVSGNSLVPINTFIDNIVNLANSGKVIKRLSIQSLTYNSGSEQYTIVILSDVL